jgi:hypothetical protein
MGRLETEEEMELHSPGQAIAELSAAATMQTEATYQRMVFTWGQALFTELRRVWAQLETEEALAYEDKLAAQVHVLEEASAGLGQLYHTVRRTRRRLARHLQSLRRLFSVGPSRPELLARARRKLPLHAGTPRM